MVTKTWQEGQNELMAKVNSGELVMATFKADNKEVKKVVDTEKKDFQMSQLEGIRRGQAFNLAVQAAIAQGVNTATDKKEIFSLFIFYYELGKLSQTYSMDEIKSIIE